MMWCFGQMALFLFLLVRAALAYLPTALSVALKPLIPFRQAQYVQVFPLKPVPFCMLFAGLGSTNKSTIFPLISNSVADLAQTVLSLLLFYQATIGPQRLVSPRNNLADELARRGALLAPYAIACSLSLISRIHSCLFSDWRRTVSSKFFDAQVSSISIEELVLPHHACCVLSRLRCNEHSHLLGSYLSRIGRTENPSCSACGHSSQDTSDLILHCPATDSLHRSLFGNSLSLYDLWPRPWGSAMPPSLERGWVNNNNNK